MNHEDWQRKAEKTVNGMDAAYLNLDFDALQKELSHVYWIGGSGCASKSTISKLLAAQHGLRVYHSDDHRLDYFSRIQREGLPLPTLAPAVDNLFAGRKLFGQDLADIDPAEYMARCFAIWQEELTLVLDDLRGMAPAFAIAEGVPFVPWLLPKMAPRSRIATMIGSDSFRRKTYMNPDRPELVLKRFSESDNPGRALENVLQANALIVEMLLRSAHEQNWFVVEVDGTRDADAIARVVAEHFGL